MKSFSLFLFMPTKKDCKAGWYNFRRNIPFICRKTKTEAIWFSILLEFRRIPVGKVGGFPFEDNEPLEKIWTLCELCASNKIYISSFWNIIYFLCSHGFHLYAPKGSLLSMMLLIKMKSRNPYCLIFLSLYFLTKHLQNHFKSKS